MQVGKEDIRFEADLFYNKLITNSGKLEELFTTQYLKIALIAKLVVNHYHY